MTLRGRVREDPIRALVWIEATATVLAVAADVSLPLLDPVEAAPNWHLYPLTAAATAICMVAIFSIPHAPNKRYAGIGVACVALLLVGYLPPPGLLMFVLSATLAARLTFAFGSRGAVMAWVVACVALTVRVYAQTHGAASAHFDTWFAAFVAYALQIGPFAILLALIFGIIGLMKVYASSSADAAAASERSRIALDLHDFLGHGLTTLRVQLQNAERYRSSDPDKAGDYLQRAVASSGNLLDDVRETVGLLHDDAERATPSFSILFDRLCSDYAATHDVVVERRIDIAREPTGRVAVALYRAIQEALTNVARHARARHVWIAVRGDDHRLEASVEDDGCGLSDDASGRGHGLRSMRERISGVSGEFSIAGRNGGGTVVRAAVPVEAAR